MALNCVSATPPIGVWRFLTILSGAWLFATGMPDLAANPIQPVPNETLGWPQFRGPARNGISAEPNLLTSWAEGGPTKLWSIAGLGRGFSSPTLSSDRLYITGDIEGELVIHAFDLQGDALWRATNGLAWNGPYPGSRSSVTISVDHLYHMNAHGRLVCLRAETGAEVWSVDVLKQFRGQNITWGLSECLVVDDTSVYVTAGGEDGLVVALDKSTGTVRWQSEPLPDSREPGKFEPASYVSPILVQFEGQTLLIGCSLRHLYCVDASTGRLQWTRPRPTNYSVLAMMPVVVGDRIFMSAPHGPPGTFYRLLAKTDQEPDARIGVEEVGTSRLDTCQGSVVHVAGRLYGSFYPGRKGWAAVDGETGAVLYEEAGFVKGAVLYADNHLYALCEDGQMLLLKPEVDRFMVRSQFRFVNATDRDAWAHPVIHQGRLYLRFHEELTCFDIRATGN